MKYQYFLLPIPLVVSWGGDGHSMVTKVASGLMSDAGVRFVNNLIGEDWILASRWADTPEASERYPESDDYHFSHTPYRDCQPFLLGRDCGFPGKEGLCIVTGLADAIMMAIDPEISRENRTDALKFVLHFMADIHQPLHTGFREDAGGTGIEIRNSVNATLHSLWDYGLIENHLDGSRWEKMSDTILNSVNSRGGQFVQRIANQTDIVSVLLNGTRDAIIDYVSTLATDTTMSSTCKFAYMNEKSEYIENGDLVSDTYISRGKLNVQIQLSKAAVRLALLLNAMGDVYASRVAELKEVSRAIRADKLFERMRLDAAERAARVRDPLAGNRFALLSIDFDIEEYLFEPLEDVVVPKSTKMSVKERKALVAARKAKEARRLANKLRRDARKRTARLVDGIDLSSLVLIKTEGHYVITMESLVAETKIRLMINRIYIKFANSELVPFGLDYKVFKTVPSEAFLLRLFRQLKFEDEADTGVFADISSVVTPPTSETDPRREAYYARFKSVEERLRFEKEADLRNTAHWKKYQNDMISISFPGGTTFISTYSLCRNPERKRFVMNQFGIKNEHSKGDSQVFLIDQEFFDEDFTTGVVEYMGIMLSKKATRARTEKLVEVNPELGFNMHRFIDAIGLGVGPRNPERIADFKECREIERSDKPYLMTLAVDFTLDISCLPSFISMFQRKIAEALHEKYGGDYIVGKPSR